MKGAAEFQQTTNSVKAKQGPRAAVAELYGSLSKFHFINAYRTEIKMMPL